MDELAKWIVKKFHNINKQSDNDNMIIQYSLEVVLENMIKIMGLLIIGWYFNKIPDFLITLIVFGSIRVNVGGIHANTNVGCTFGMILICTITSLSKAIYISELCLLILYIITLVTIILFAPKTKNRNYYTSETIKKKKVKAIILANIYILIAYWKVDFRTLIVCSIFIEVLTLLPNIRKKVIL